MADLTKLFDDYLYWSYMYYKEYESPVPDSMYDYTCRKLKDGWDELEHQYKDLSDIELLGCGSGFSIQYPPALVELIKVRASQECML